MAGEVEVIKAVEGNGTRRRNMIGSGLSIERKRVAAYVRVSTDGEEQLQSFQSQKTYYQEKISKNKEWVMVGIYADEAITGTKTVKRDGFLKMINDCMSGMIDVILTKSISRFSRNLVDTLQYVRMLKEKGIAVIFEKENINTLSMESEMALALLSTLAQNEVESLSANVKMGIKMKMKRGEMMGFNGCLGYDYHPEDKSITVNPEEAEIVREIFDMYLRGYGAPTIAKELTRLGRKNKKGEVKWTESGIRTIINNEKYKGDLRLGKTFTVDPISKRRLENMGEEEQYYIKEHHEPIVSPQVWDAAQEIKKSRYRKNAMAIEGTRKKYSRKFAFSSMCECGFCGKYLTRRSHNQTTTQTKPVWKCRTATNFGIENCPHSKSIDEAIIENAFLEMFHLLADNFDDVLDSVICSVEETLSNDESAKHTNVDTHSRLICYDILDLGKQLQPIGMLVVLDSILNRITQNRAKGRNTFIFIDEIYLLFQHEYSANFLFTLWKRVRKYGAYCTGITQNVDDLLQSHTARTMLANSEFIIMLNQASTDRIELAKLLNISDLQMSYITNVGAGQGLLKVGSSLVPFVNKFPRNTELYKLMTTKFGEC